MNSRFQDQPYWKSSSACTRSIMPCACSNVLRLFTPTSVLYQQMKAAPAAEISAQIILVGDGVGMAVVEPNRRKVKRSARHFRRNILVSRGRRFASRANDAG